MEESESSLGTLVDCWSLHFVGSWRKGEHLEDSRGNGVQIQKCDLRESVKELETGVWGDVVGEVVTRRVTEEHYRMQVTEKERERERFC